MFIDDYPVIYIRKFYTGIYIDDYRFIGIYPFLSHEKYRLLTKSDDYRYLSADNL